MTRRRKRHHSKQRSTPIAPASQELQSQNVSGKLEPKQSFLSYVSASKGFAAASLGYLTTLFQILPASAQRYEYCTGKTFWSAFSDTCYAYTQMGLREETTSSSGVCEIAAQTQWLLSKLTHALKDGACGATSAVCPDIETYDLITFVEDIAMQRGNGQTPQPDFELCIRNFISTLNEQYDPNPTDVNTWAIVGYVALAILGTCAVGAGAYYAKKFISSRLEQPQQTIQDATETTRLYNQL
jgi:hypothetical protein